MMPPLSLDYRFALSQKIKEGLSKAVSNGKKIGRPRKCDFESYSRAVFYLRMKGYSYRQMQVELGISRGTCYRLYKEYGDKYRFEMEQNLKETSQLLTKLKGELNHVNKEYS